ESVQNGTASPASGAVAQGSEPSSPVQLAYQLAPSPGTYTQRFTFSPSYNAGNQSCALIALRATSQPEITTLTPAAGAIGTTITTSGGGFGNASGTVNFNGVNANPISWSDSAITVQVPAGATSGDVTVTAGEATSNAMTFTVADSPTITNITPQ